MQKPYDIESALTKVGIGRFHFFLLLILGAIVSCDAMEMLILTFLGPILSCTWRINSLEISILTTSVFVGIIIGSFFFGIFSDKYGRKPTLVIGNIGILYYALLTAATPTIGWMVIARSIVGICLGATSCATFPLVTELSPEKFRGIFVIVLQFFWSCGTLIVTTICFFVVPMFGWRVFLLLSTIPMLFVLCGVAWLPESPRYLLLQNRKRSCLKVINRIARMNRSEMIENVSDSSIAESPYYDLIHPNYRLTSICVYYLWFMAGLAYYSVILIASIINSIPHRCLQDSTTFSQLQEDSTNQSSDDSCCFRMSLASYRNLFMSSLGELIFQFIVVVLINFTGRKRIIAVVFIIYSVGIFLFNLCLSSMQISILLSIVRGAAHSMYTINLVYTTEVFPTSVRSICLGIACNFSRLGAMVSPFIVNIFIVEHSFIGGTMLLSSFGVLAVVASFLLPYETKGRQLFQTADHGEAAADSSLKRKDSNNNTVK